MDRPLFSIIVVTLNPGDKLFQTIGSIKSQTCQDYEVVVKDGGSLDKSLEKLKELKNSPDAGDFWDRVRIYEEPDKSIYEGMNQAVKYAEGSYFYFLNCGDYFYDDRVLEKTAKEIVKVRQSTVSDPLIIYGDIHDALRSVRVASNPRLNGFGLYRNVPCHQACIYDASLFAERGYKTEYKVRGDYEHFLWSCYSKKAKTVYMPEMIASYEGGGFSETKESRRRSLEEHRKITAQYMTPGELLRYRTILFLTLAPLRTRMAESKAFSGVYQCLKRVLYGKNDSNKI